MKKIKMDCTVFEENLIEANDVLFELDHAGWLQTLSRKREETKCAGLDPV